jgi:hypothetical protein
MRNHFISCSISFTLVLALTGCASTTLNTSTPGNTSSPGESAKPTVAQVQGNTPLPPGAVIKQDKSFIIGTGDNWFGRMTLNIGRDANTAHRFFIQSYPQNGWTLVSSVRTARSLLIFTKGDRAITIEITEGNYLTSGEAVLTVSPLSKSNPMGATNITPLR